MIDLIKFQLYLKAIIDNSQRKISLGDRYISTFAELRVKVTDYSSKDKKEESKSYFVLEGLQKYASKQVSLFGKLGSGKSTALREFQFEQAERCLNAISQNSNQIFQIPILIELRSLKTSAVEKIQEKLELHGIDLDQIRRFSFSCISSQKNVLV